MSIYDKASLVLIPSGTKTSKVYSQVPTNGDGDFTFSRSTAATRVNASGNIEKETQNLARYSNDFSNSVWYKYTNTTYTLTTETITDPFGVSTSVYKVTLTGSGYLTLRQEFSGDTRYMTASAYIKKSSSGLNVALDQSDGNVENAAANTDWQRLSSSHASGYSFSFIDITITGVSGDYCYVSSAQMELGGAARDYIETTTTAIYGGITDNVPRLDYTDSSCPALLLEPQRTNSAEYSEYFSTGSGYWGNTRSSVVSNDIVSPEGVQNGTKLLQDSSTTTAGLVNENITASGTNTFSFYAKKGSVNFTRLSLYNSAETSVYFDLENGEIGTTNLIAESDCFIEDAGNGWYRCGATYSGATNRFNIYLADRDGQITLLDASNAYIYIYGAQWEKNSSYATSYIPTYGSAVTRNADNPTLGNLQSNNIAGDTFSYFFEWGDYVADRNFEIRDSSNTNFLFMVSRLFRYNNDSGGVDSLMILPTSGTALKCMVTYDGTTLKGFVNGALEGSVTDAKASQFSDFNYLRLDRDNPDSEELRSLMIFPTALTDQEAIDLTTI